MGWCYIVSKFKGFNGGNPRMYECWKILKASEVPMTEREIRAKFPNRDASLNTDLRYLVHNGDVLRVKAGRGFRYEVARK